MADHATPVTTCVARIAQIEAFDPPALLASRAQRTIQSRKPASILRPQPGEVEVLDGLGACVVTGRGGRMVEIVGQIGAHHEQGVLIQDSADNGHDLFGRSIAHEQGNQPEAAKHVK